MTNKERLEKYKKEHCCKCKNKDKDLCDIRVFAVDKIIYTKCGFYEREQIEISHKSKRQKVKKDIPFYKYFFIFQEE